MNKFSIEDETHAEFQGDFRSFDEALNELKRRAKIPWNEPPNKCPCTGWETCDRRYSITEFLIGDSTYTPQSEAEVLTISAKEILWLSGYEQNGS